MRDPFYLFIVLIWVNSFAQQTDFVDFTQARAEIIIEPHTKHVSGKISYSFDILEAVESIFIDAKNMNIDKVILNETESAFNYDSKKIRINRTFKPSHHNNIQIVYNTFPKKAMYFLGWENGAPDQVWTQGQGKYTSNWLPSIDDMNEKIEFDLKISAPSEYQVIANGKLIRKENVEAQLTQWYYNMNNPMSSYLVGLVVGTYSKQTQFSNSGIPLEMYYYPEDSLKFEPTYRYTREIFDFLEEELGMPYPWQNYKQVPVHDFLYAGMENTGTTFFSDAFVVDSLSFKDRNYVNVNAHELAHQWFGNLVTETSGTHHWLHEGFAAYYALLAEKHVFGEDQFYWKLYESALQLEQQDRVSESTALLDPTASSLTFYEKGAWTLFMLRELVGDLVFKEAVKTYLEMYQYKNVSTPDFMGIVEDLGEIDLTAFAYEWLRNADFPLERALDALKQNSSFIDEYIMVDCAVNNSKCEEYLLSGISDKAKMKVISQNQELVNAQVFKNSVNVRQAIAQHMTSISLKLKSQYESLLTDPSYATVEAALYNLWVSYPEERSKYLDATKSVYGFNDYNVRLLWLALHLNTSEYEPDRKQDIYNELLKYTSGVYNPQTRIQAINYLTMMNACNEACKKNLNDASTHHFWQLSKFAKETLAKMNKQ